LVFVLFAFDALAQLNGLLKGMHGAGKPAVGVGDFADLFTSPFNAQPENVRKVWSDHAASTAIVDGERPYATYQVVYGWHFAIDCALAIVLGLLLYVTAGLLADALGKANSGGLPTVAKWAAGAYAVFDLGENVLSAFVVHGRDVPGLPIWVAAWGKTLAFAVALVALVALAGIGWRRAEQAAGADVAKAPHSSQLRVLVLRLRVYVLLVFIFGVVLTAHEQVVDVLRRLTPFQLAASIIAAGFLGLVVWVLSHELAAVGVDRWDWARQPVWIARALVAVALLTAALTAFMSFGLDADWDFGWGLLIPAGFIGLIWLVGKALPPPSQDPPKRTDPTYATIALPALLAAALFVGLGLGLFRAAFGEGVYTGELWSTKFFRGWNGQLHPPALVIASLALPLAAWGVYELLTRAERTLDSRQRTWLVVAGAAFVLQLVVALFVWIWPREMGETFGGVALLAIALAGVGFFLGFVVWLTDTCPLPKRYWSLRLQRAPVVLLLIVWFLIVSKVDQTGPHDIRIRDATLGATAPTVEQAWACWLVKNSLDPSPFECPFPATEFEHRSPTTTAVPLVFVATSGGATRAAYWTSTVLDCVLETTDQEGAACARRVAADDFRRSNAVFALSGISGGSVGFATYAARLVEKEREATNPAWIDERLDRDFLSPTIGWAMFVEVPQSLLRFRHPVDRAEVLERSWEQAWSEGGVGSSLGLFQLWRKHHVVPLLLLNGTSVEDGCRFNGSVVDGNIESHRGKEPMTQSCRSTAAFDDVPADSDAATAADELSPKSAFAGTRDLSDFLCGRKVDVRLSTAAILSARFPYVSPSGRVQGRCELAEGESRKATYVVDGGYLETSGASPIVELSAKLLPIVGRFNRRAPARACVVPFMIQIDNGYEDDAAAKATKRPPELGVPALTILATRGAREANAKGMAGLLFEGPVNGVRVNMGTELLTDRYAHFVIQAHAGPKAPLGWALSDTARSELRSQLGQPKNLGALQEVRSWFEEGALTCSRPQAARSGGR
jgi:hypothetical protein